VSYFKFVCLDSAAGPHACTSTTPQEGSIRATASATLPPVVEVKGWCPCPLPETQIVPLDRAGIVEAILVRHRYRVHRSWRAGAALLLPIRCRRSGYEPYRIRPRVDPEIWRSETSYQGLQSRLDKTSRRASRRRRRRRWRRRTGVHGAKGKYANGTKPQSIR
jgi:hypothetical protein